jgi:hypothetical protein
MEVGNIDRIKVVGPQSAISQGKPRIAAAIDEQSLPGRGGDDHVRMILVMA